MTREELLINAILKGNKEGIYMPLVGEFLLA
jgi:hypothetical protein